MKSILKGSNTPYLQGKPGIGKSAIVRKLAEEFAEDREIVNSIKHMGKYPQNIGTLTKGSLMYSLKILSTLVSMSASTKIYFEVRIFS